MKFFNWFRRINAKEALKISDENHRSKTVQRYIKELYNDILGHIREDCNNGFYNTTCGIRLYTNKEIWAVIYKLEDNGYTVRCHEETIFISWKKI